MPLRFRKIIPFGKGLRLNISKKGISSSFGKPGATMNVGKNGIRPTIGVPGTGLSFTPSNSGTNQSAKNTSIGLIVFIIIALVICFTAICCIGFYFIPTPNLDSTATPKTSPLSVDEIIVRTAAAAQTQTFIVAPPTSTPFLAVTPATLVPVTMAPSFTPLPSATSFLLVIPQPSASTGEACSCAGDLYNCTSNFSTHAQAQACFEFCVAQGVGDIHKLDQNNDGLACEDLP